MTTPHPPVRYVHVLSFKAVHQLKDQRTGKAEHDLHGHAYTVELGFEDADPAGLGLSERASTQEAVSLLTEFVAANLNGRDLSRMQFRTTPTGLAWYLFERVAEHGDAFAGLTDITLIVDGADRWTYRPSP